MKKDVTTNNIAEQVTNLPSVQNEALAKIIKGLYQGKPLLGPSGLLTSLVKDLSQIALQGGMDSHMHEDSLEQGGNRSNGVTTKTIKTGSVSFELAVPRDRNATFAPQLIKKRQTVLTEELDNKILALYGFGTSYDGIASHLQEIYGV